MHIVKSGQSANLIIQTMKQLFEETVKFNDRHLNAFKKL